MVERIVASEEYKRLFDDIDYFNSLNMALLPLNITKIINNKKKIIWKL